MSVKAGQEIVSCYQCAGITYCYEVKNPEIERVTARAEAALCTSLRKGSPNETVTVCGFDKGLSRKNAEKLVLNGYARWRSYKTIEPVTELPIGIYNRLTKKKQKEEEKDMLYIR